MQKSAKFLTVFGIVVASAIITAGTTKETTATETTATVGSHAAAGAKQDMAMFKQEMSMKLESAEAQIMALKEKAKVKGSNVKQSTIADLESTKMRIKNDLSALEKSSETNWKKMKSKIATAMDDLNTKTQKLLRE